MNEFNMNAIINEIEKGTKEAHKLSFQYLREIDIPKQMQKSRDTGKRECHFWGDAIHFTWCEIVKKFHENNQEELFKRNQHLVIDPLVTKVVSNLIDEIEKKEKKEN